ncbi:fimbria/pilus outer membrane usher protein [Vibrio sp. S4M6]|uniref:fimbria/pilus outer membrane usher protein n=1 Tax=Vibrio sinus TaxID=2946865 RepID=UPI00202A90F0|nr:fimbria/pilus outer membrane usher protein [Vibrio sinus]MCL9779914.1 fimbria/pilus outer membrane usher protein [Vibrio sinus]
MFTAKATSRHCLLKQGVLLFALTATTSAFADQTTIPAICFQNQADPIISAVYLNGEAGQLWPVCQQGNQFWIPKNFFTEHAIKNFKDLQTTTKSGVDFVVMSSNSRELQWDDQTQAIKLFLPSWRFQHTRLNLKYGSDNASSIEPSSANGVFLNYNLISSLINPSNSYSTSATGEIGVFTKDSGYFSQTGTYSPDIANSEEPSDDQTPQWLRLDTNWRRDYLDDLTTLEIGDSTTTAAHWGGSVNFAGISYYKNYSLKPQLDIRSLPLITGQTDLPQNVKLDVNGVPVGNYQVNPGSYQFYNIPVSDGSGTITVQSTNKDGKVTTYKIPYFASINILRPGLSSYGYQFGSLRENYGIESFDYGKLFGAINYTHGVTPIWTYQVHSSVLAQQQTFGTSQFIKVGENSAVTTDAAISQRNSTIGGLGALGYQFQYHDASFTANYQITSKHFTQLATADTDFDDLGQGYQASAGINIPLTNWSTFSASALYDHSSVETIPSSHVYTAQLSANVTQNLSITSNYQANFSDDHQWSIGLNINYLFGTDSEVSTSVEQDQDTTNQFLSFMTSNQFSDGKSLTSNISVSHDVSESSNQLYGSLFLSGTQTGNYSANVYQYGSQSQVSLMANGGMLWMDNHFLLTPPIYSSFALVDTSGYSGIGVKQNGAVIGKTNSDGLFVVPNLASYIPNDISLSQDIPLDLKELSVNQDVMPTYRSGIDVHFDVERIHQILVNVKNAKGDPLPVGTLVSVQSGSETQQQIIGDDGLLYLSSGSLNFHGKVLDGDFQGSHFDIHLKPSKSVIVRASTVYT